MEKDSRLDLYGQMPFLNLYTQISLCYPTPNDDVSCHEISAILTAGLDRLSKDIPWLAGKIVSSTENDQPSKIFRIVPHQSSPVFIARDLRNDPSIPTMQSLRENRFPCSMMNENWLTTYSTFQPGRAGSSPEPTVVFALQANFIKGGVILTFVGHHQAMDMVGMGRILEWLSRTCNGEGLTEEEKRVANLARWDLIPLLPYDEVPDIPTAPTQPKETDKTTADLDPPSIKTPPCKWAYFSFSAASLSRIKKIATKTRYRNKPMWDLSTDDALTAYIWKCVSRSRIPRLSTTPFPTPDPNNTSIATTQASTKITRAVDMRRYFGLPANYPGMMQSLSYSAPKNIGGMQHLPLGAIASRLREAIHLHPNPKPEFEAELEVVRDARVLVTKIQKSCSGEGLYFGEEVINPSLDLMISSWAKVNECWALDFGMGLGRPEVVRRPSFDPVEGLVYFLPRGPPEDADGDEGSGRGASGEIVVMVCLREEDMERLKGEFGDLAEFIG